MFREHRAPVSTATKAITTRITIDTRSLAAFRILAGLLLIADVLLRARRFTDHYTGAGFVPAELARSVGHDGAFSLFWLTDDPAGVAILFALHLLVGILLLVGYRTRMMTILAFVFVASLDIRNPLVISYADWLFRLLLFWAIFLPLGERWSIDAVYRRRWPRRSVAGLASAMILAQMVFMYLVNGLLKTSGETWRSGEAAVLVFGLDDTTYLLGDSLRSVPELVAAGGFAWFILLLLSPLLLVTTGRRRLVLILLIGAGHLAFAVTVRIGAFPYVGVLGLLAFIQPSMWADIGWLTDRLGFVAMYQRLREFGTSIAELCPYPTFNRPSLHRTMALVGSFVLWSVVLSLVLLGALLVPQAGMLLDPGDDAHDRLERAIDDQPVAAAIYDVHQRIGIEQPSWNIFAPEPRSTDRYYVLAAQTVDGSWIDLRTGETVTLERPFDRLHRQHDTYRDRFFMTRLTQTDRFHGVAAAYLNHHCEGASAELTSISLIEVRETVTPETIDMPVDRPRYSHLVATIGCGEHEPEPFELDG